MIFTDKRGELHSLKNIPFEAKEILISNTQKNTLKGLHSSPYAKYIYVIEGKIYDFYYSDEKEYIEKILNKGESIFVPPYSAHGYFSCENSSVLYLLENTFDVNIDKNIYYLSPELKFKYDFLEHNNNLIISDKDNDADYLFQYDYVVLGSNGYLGSNMCKYLNDNNKTYLPITTRLNNITKLTEQIKKSKCKYVICAAGISGKPTVEWCETHGKETFDINYLDMLNLMQLCETLKVHLTIFGSGLVFDGKKEIYTEEDVPNLTNRVYTKLRCELENKLHLFPNTLYLRILYPCTFDGHPKCFYTKTKSRADNINDVKVPLTIVPYLFKYIPEIIESGTVGILNFTNNGNVSLVKLLELSNIEYTINNSNNSNNYKLSTNLLESILHKKIENVEEIIKTFI